MNDVPDYSDPSSYIHPGIAKEIALDGAKDALRFNTLGGNVFRQGGTVFFDYVPVKLNAERESRPGCPRLLWESDCYLAKGL